MRRLAGHLAVDREFEQRPAGEVRAAGPQRLKPGPSGQLFSQVRVGAQARDHLGVVQVGDRVLAANRHYPEIVVQQLVPNPELAAARRGPFIAVGGAKRCVHLAGLALISASQAA